MQINTLKLKTPRKKKKTIGRGGKKGTYSGRGNKGQKARSGAHVNPLFEGGRSTLIEHMKKKRGFTSRKPENNVISLSVLDKKFKNGDIINAESLVKAKLMSLKNSSDPIKILGKEEIKGKFTIGKNILLSDGAKTSIEKAGGTISKS